MSDEITARFGKYELIDRLGRGGMADVWRARVAGPQGFARTLVLKRILPHLVEDQRARVLFEREARVSSRLSHANIVQVFEFGEIDGEYYLTMEYIEGRDLAALIRSGGATPPVAALVMREVCRALAYAHELRDERGAPLRILHRDVSPSNIMIGYDGSVRLLDFGIAKAFADARDGGTIKGTIRGKFGYLAPEVLEGLEPDGRADLFSVGVVLHEALSGKRLFRGTSDLETLALVKRAEIPLPSSLNPAVPQRLEQICMRALERDRDQRYASCEEMAHALDQVVLELRFGPAQLGEVLQQVFPRGTFEAPLAFEDSGPRTVSESPIVEAGIGTARVPEPPLEERATIPMGSSAASLLAKATKSTVAARRVASTPSIVDGNAATVMQDAPPRAKDVEVETRTPRAPATVRPTWPYFAGGLVLGCLLIAGFLVFGGGTLDEPKAPAMKPEAIATPDLAVKHDLGEVRLLFPHSDTEMPPLESPNKKR